MTTVPPSVHALAAGIGAWPSDEEVCRHPTSETRTSDAISGRKVDMGRVSAGTGRGRANGGRGNLPQPDPPIRERDENRHLVNRRRSHTGAPGWREGFDGLLSGADAAGSQGSRNHPDPIPRAPFPI